MTSPVGIKICGVTEPDDAARVAAAGADFLGLNFWPPSKRGLAPARAAPVAAAARAAGPARIVGVFVDASAAEILRVLAHVELDAVQLHGVASPAALAVIAEAVRRPLWRAIAAGGAADLADLDAWPAAATLVDTPTPGRGGSGRTFDWTLARDARARHPAVPLVLAGGLTPANVAAAIAAVSPWAVDVASGVEAAPGRKDPALGAAVIAAARGRGMAGP